MVMVVGAFSFVDKFPHSTSNYNSSSYFYFERKVINHKEFRCEKIYTKLSRNSLLRIKIK